tara:strand:- start:738 stop:893 length:156 start_codon:yes stop_codon:yes gene_type:complete
MKEYTVYYYRLLKSGPLSTTVEANSEDEALELASKKTAFYKRCLTLTEPKY